MKQIYLTFLFVLGSIYSFGQVQAQGDCSTGGPGCDIPDFVLEGANPLGTGTNLIDDLPTGLNVSNPSTNPGTAGNSGCLLSSELNPVWMIFTVVGDGDLEFTIGEVGNTGFFDWSLWPYYESSAGGTSACEDITNNVLAPVACNWNSFSVGYTGMASAGNLPMGADQGNFENAISVTAGQQFVLCFSNYSALGDPMNPVPIPVLTGVNIPGNTSSTSTAALSCAENIAQTVCIGESATINLIAEAGVTYNWLNGAADIDDPNDGPEFVITPSDTTIYNVEISQNGVIVDTSVVTINVAFPPTPNAGIDTTLCFGDIASFAGTISNTNHTVSWTVVGPGLAVVSPNSQISTTLFGSEMGDYTVTLTESNGVCPDGTDDKIVTFTEPTLSLTATDPSCFGYTDGEISVATNSGIEFSKDNGATWQPDPLFTGLVSGTYDICVKDAFGCQKCDQVVLTDPAETVISVSNDTTICRNGTATLIATATGGTSYTFNWSQTTDNAGTQAVNPIITDTYTVQAFNQNNCPSLIESITVTLLPELTGTVTPLNPTICPGYPVELTVTGADGNGGPYTYVWLDGNMNPVGVGENYTANPAVTTTYTAVVADACETTPFNVPNTVTVAPVPQVQFSVDRPEDCEPARFSFMNDTDPALVAQTFWYFSNDSVGHNQNLIDVTFETDGIYDGQLIVVSPDGCIDSLKQEGIVVVHPLPEPDFSFPSPITMFNTDVNFNNTTQGGETYVWSFTLGDPGVSTSEDVSVRFPDGVVGSYPVDLIATSDQGCKDTITKIVNILQDIIFYAPNTFTPDGDEFNQNWKVYAEGIDIYQYSMEIFDRWGRKVWESHDVSVPWDGTFNGKILPQGTYVWRMKAKNRIDDGKFEREGYVTILK